MKQIKDYVEHELNIFRKECNFSVEELEYFNMKARNYSNIRISTEMNVSLSTIGRIAKSVNQKVKRVEKLLLTE